MTKYDQEDLEWQDEWQQFWDDIAGTELDSGMVRVARQDEMKISK